MPAHSHPDGALPTGIVTFLFTDIEGSTRLWQDEPSRMQRAMERHEAVVRAAVTAHHGVVVKMLGDGVHAAFSDALCAIRATLQLQNILADAAVTNGIALRVRCGIHAGPAQSRDGDYFGSTVNQAARLAATAHGGQIVVSAGVRSAALARLPPELWLKDLGPTLLRDFPNPEPVYQVVAPGLRVDFPPLRRPSIPNNLPRPATTFVGREHDIAAVANHLTQDRLVTVTGTGGIGKTRFAVEVASGFRERSADGVWLVELAALADPLLVISTVARTLGATEVARDSALETLKQHVADKELLLVLDNCEHVLASCREVAAALRDAAPHVRILATSREPLSVAGETVYPLGPLATPDKHAAMTDLERYEAVRLFRDRAALRRPGFAVDANNAFAVAEICRRLDGIPLALELAAARVRTFSVADLAAQLDQRLDLLAGGLVTALPRQQTLRTLIDWSYDLLTGREQTVFRCLAIFAGGWTLEAAEEVATGNEVPLPMVSALLTGLAQKSLVVVDETQQRYRMLETIRAYALEQLAAAGEAGATRRRHARYFRDRFDAAFDSWLRVGDEGWRSSYEPELDNVRAALDWALAADGDPALAVALAGASAPIFAESADAQEQAHRLTTAAAHVSSQSPEVDQARLYLWLGHLRSGIERPRAMSALEHSNRRGGRRAEETGRCLW